MTACVSAPRPSQLAGEAVASDIGLAYLGPIRSTQGLGELQPDGALGRAALVQAKLMAESGRMSHTVRAGKDFKRRMGDGGIAGPAAENIAHGRFKSDRLFEMWMASPPHRRNMLDTRFAKFGLAYAQDSKGERWWALVLSN